MTVIAFPALACDLDRGWRPFELERLVSLCPAHAAWDTGATERGDPQFYVLGPAPEHDCIACVSRVGSVYVLEDGAGTLIVDDARLEAVVDRAVRMLRRARKTSFIMRGMLMLCSARLLVEEKFEPVLEESSEMVARFAPQLAAFV